MTTKPNAPVPAKLSVQQRPDERRLTELRSKQARTAADVQEEILLRLRRIEEKLGIK